MTFAKFARRAFVAATALTAAASPAAAQQIDRIVVFGDSYADQGNLFALGYADPLAKTIYPTGRFSGGTNYIDTLHTLLGAPVYNYAIGGAMGGMNNNVVCFGDPTYGAPACGKGLQYEVDQFLAGPTNGVYPTTSTSFSESDLLAISIGGNDARLYQGAGGTLAGAPTAGAAAAATSATTIDRLMVGGTPTISVLAGDTGKLPEIANNPAGAAIRTAYSNSFNSAIQGTLAGYAAGGSIVHYLDLSAVLGNVVANPTAYGITNGVACPLFATGNLTCLTGGSRGYLFYGDGIHLTSDGFAIVANYVARQLAAPLTLAAPADVGVDLGHQFGRTLGSRSTALGANPGAPTGMHLFAVGDAFESKHGLTRGNAGFTSKGFGITMGAQFGFAAGNAGLAVNYSRPKARFATNSAYVNSRSIQVGAFGGMGFGTGGFANAHVGYGWDKHQISREGVIENMDASPKGNHLTAGVKAGYLLPLGGVSVGPIVALDYARAKVRAYREDGDPALTLNVSGQHYKSLRGNLGLEARANLGQDLNLQPFINASLEKELQGDGRAVSFSQVTAPGIVNTFGAEDRSKKMYGRISLGGLTQITGNVALDAGLSLTVARKNGNEASGHVAMSIGF